MSDELSATNLRRVYSDTYSKSQNLYTITGSAMLPEVSVFRRLKH